MGRQRAGMIKIAPELVHHMGERVVLTGDVVEAYIRQLRLQGRREDSVRDSQAILAQFMDALPDSKQLDRYTLQRWRESLLDEGYAVRTVNSKVSLINSLLESMDCRSFQVSAQLVAEAYTPPELTRQEYLRMLKTARDQGDQRGYLLAELFVTTGIAVADLPLVTVESAQVGCVQVDRGRKKTLLHYPECLRSHLLCYAQEHGLHSGMIFIKRNGEPLARTQVSLYVRRLAEAAHVPLEKGNVRALRQLHRVTLAGIEANFDLLVQQAHERQLELEQMRVGWNGGKNDES